LGGAVRGKKGKMAITYNAGTNIITVTGYTAGTPCTFLNLWNADQLGGWNKITRQCTDQYCFTANLQIGDGTITTWFGDTNKQIVFNCAPFVSPIKGFNVSVLVKNNATFRLGKLKDAGLKTTNKGCAFSYRYGSTHSTIMGDAVDGANIELYSTQIISPNHIFFLAMSENLKLYNSILADGVELYELFGVDIYNVVLQNHDNRFGIVNCIGEMDTISINNFWYAINVTTYDYGESVVFKNLKMADSSNYMMYLSDLDFDDALLINCESDVWSFLWEPANPSTKHVIRQYEFDLKVMDKAGVNINGATVKIWDKDNNLVVNTTTAGGVISMQTLNYGYYSDAGGSTPVMQTPHTIEISKAGYETYKTAFMVDVKINWRIRLLEAMPVRQCDNDMILQLRPESQEDDRFLYTRI